MILIEMKNRALLNLAHVIELKADFTGETKDGLKVYGIHASTVDGKTRKGAVPSWIQRRQPRGCSTT